MILSFSDKLDASRFITVQVNYTHTLINIILKVKIDQNIYKLEGQDVMTIYILRDGKMCPFIA